METLDLEENRIQYTVLRLRGKSLADENYHFHVVFPKSCCASLASLLCVAIKVKEFQVKAFLKLNIMAIRVQDRSYTPEGTYNGLFAFILLLVTKYVESTL